MKKYNSLMKKLFFLPSNYKRAKFLLDTYNFFLVITYDVTKVNFRTKKSL